jgi:hypothetical protein
MRRAWACAFAAVLLTLAFAGRAAAAPTVTFRTTPIPIPGFKGTGDILGAGAQIAVQVMIAGAEYGGFPSPLVGMRIYAPSGVEVSSRGFGSCAPAVLEADGPSRCPQSSRAGPTGEGLGVVSFGGERVNEKVSLQSFFTPTGGLAFYAVGRTPTFFEILEKGFWSSASAPYGPELTVEIPLVETVPGADDASILSFEVKVGAAYKRAGKTVSYITLPRSCPRGGAPLKAELTFMSGETVTIAYRQPCPKHG